MVCIISTYIKEWGTEGIQPESVHAECLHNVILYAVDLPDAYRTDGLHPEGQHVSYDFGLTH